MSSTSENQLKLQLLTKLSAWQQWPTDELSEFIAEFIKSYPEVIYINTVQSETLYRGTSFSVTDRKAAFQEIKKAIASSAYSANDHSLVKLNLTVQYKPKRYCTSWTSNIQTAQKFLRSYQKPDKIPLILSGTPSEIQKQNASIISLEDVLDFCSEIAKMKVSSAYHSKAKEVAKLFVEEQESVVVTDTPIQNLNVLVSKSTVDKILNS